MKLLFDQNLSDRLIRLLADLYPGSTHVKHAGLDTAEDVDLWEYAREQGFVIVSKDADFQELSIPFGHPPKVIWIQRGNCPTSVVVALLRERFDDIQDFVQDHVRGYLIVA